MAWLHGVWIDGMFGIWLIGVSVARFGFVDYDL